MKQRKEYYLANDVFGERSMQHALRHVNKKSKRTSFGDIFYVVGTLTAIALSLWLLISFIQELFFGR